MAAILNNPEDLNALLRHPLWHSSYAANMAAEQTLEPWLATHLQLSKLNHYKIINLAMLMPTCSQGLTLLHDHCTSSCRF